MHKDRRNSNAPQLAGSESQSDSNSDGKRVRARSSIWSQFGRSGGLWDEPIHWAIPITPRRFPVRVSIHLVLLLYCLVQIIRTIWPASDYPMGGEWSFSMTGLGALVFCLIVHECCHFVVNRMLQGETDEIAVWPLGSLFPYHVPGGWKPNVLVSLAGPLMNLTVCLVLTPVLYFAITHEWSAVFFNPLDPKAGHSTWITTALERPPWWQIAIWWVNYVSLNLLLLNLLPLYPLDGAYILQHGLRSKWSDDRAVEIVTAIGYGLAIVLGVIAFVAGNSILMLVAIGGALSTWLKRRQVEFLQDPTLTSESSSSHSTQSANVRGVEDIDETVELEQLAPLAFSNSDDPAAGGLAGQQLADEQELAIDAILQRISASGIDSLTAEERQMLEEATRRRQDASPKDG